MNPAQIIEYLNENNFEVFIDYWNEQDLYFGRHGNLLMEVDQIFGSNKFKLGAGQYLSHLQMNLLIRNDFNCRFQIDE